MNTETRKARSTKTTIERTDREIVCVDHAGVLELDSIKQAREFMSCPQDWCMDCQEIFYHAATNQPERIETMNTETTTATTTYEVKASLPRGIQFHTSSWECDTQEEAMNLADSLAADGWKMVCVFETTTREITR